MAENNFIQYNTYMFSKVKNAQKLQSQVLLLNKGNQGKNNIEKF